MQVNMKPAPGNGMDHFSNSQDGLAANNGMTNGRIKVLVANDHPIVREGMAALLARQSDMEVVGEAGDGSVHSGMDGSAPDVVLLDFATSISVFDVARKYSSAKVVVFTARQSEEDIYKAVQAGARGYLLTSASLDEIVACIRAIAEGRSWMPRNIAELLARRMTAPQLTRREQDVLSAVAQGKSNKEIGVALGLSEGTVKVHISHILEKLKVNGRTEALAIAATRGLVSLTARSTSTIEAA